MHGQGICTDEREVEQLIGKPPPLPPPLCASLTRCLMHLSTTSTSICVTDDRERSRTQLMESRVRGLPTDVFSGLQHAESRQCWCAVLVPSAEKGEQISLEHPNNSHIPCSPGDKKCIQKQIAKRDLTKINPAGGRQDGTLTAVSPQAPCRAELQRALERLASHTRTHEDLYTFLIPNCDKNGDFHPKQCHPARDGQRGKCWCVDQKTGTKLGSQEAKGELDCHQLLGEPLRE
ncbi:IBP4 protein, partial [Amia calva]|nr:IBP4 protein [Amia calva]